MITEVSLLRITLLYECIKLVKRINPKHSYHKERIPFLSSLLKNYMYINNILKYKKIICMSEDGC